jgi:hypothetical protein
VITPALNVHTYALQVEIDHVVSSTGSTDVGHVASNSVSSLKMLTGSSSVPVTTRLRLDQASTTNNSSQSGSKVPVASVTTLALTCGPPGFADMSAETLEGQHFGSNGPRTLFTF